VEEVSIFRLVISLIFVNGLGFILRYYGYDTYAIIAGFRLHLSFCLPLLVLFPRGIVKNVIKTFSCPVYKRKFLPLTWIIFIPLIIMGGLFLLNKIELADPDYFYEFGLSSIIDYPVYLFWNLPQFLLLFLFLKYCTIKMENKFFPAFLLIIFLFAYEFIPVNFVFTGSDITSVANFLLLSLCTAFIFHFYNNIYWLTATIFTAMWFNLLAFGTQTTSLVNMLFAAQYQKWEGFFTVDPVIKQWILAAQLALLFIMLLFYLPTRAYVGADDSTDLELHSIKSDLTA
jgi:hypothetical protein